MSLALLLSACTHSFGLRYPPARWVVENDARPIASPSHAMPFRYPLVALDPKTRQVEMLFELGARVTELPLSAVPGGTTEAQNVNNFDEAPDSAWFTNRLGRRDMTPAEFIAGPGAVSLAVREPLEVTAMGRAIATDWLAARDADSNEYLFTFDRPDRPEMSTGAGFLASRVLFAAGYHIPKSNLTTVDPAQFHVASGATTQDIRGEVRPATADDLPAFFAGVATAPHAKRIRALVTQKPDGTFLGPFTFHGRRYRDLNDRIAHQNRRELRGLDVFCAWLEHRLAIAPHTADIFVGDATTAGHVVHYLFGFEDSLGNFSASMAAQGPPPHPESKLTSTRMGLPDVTLYSQRTVMTTPSTPTPFDAAHLNPYWWEPHTTNPALWNETNRDALWASEILTRFTDQRIAALIDAAAFSNPQMRADLLRALRERRDKLLAFWLARTNPIGHFTATSQDQGATIGFEDFAATARIPGGEGSTYRWRLRTANAEAVLIDWTTAPGPTIAIPHETLSTVGAEQILSLQIQTLRPNTRWSSASVDVHLQKDDAGALRLLGITRHARN